MTLNEYRLMMWSYRLAIYGFNASNWISNHNLDVLIRRTHN